MLGSFSPVPTPSLDLAGVGGNQVIRERRLQDRLQQAVLIFAAHAALALDVARREEAQQNHAANLHTGMVSREIIGQAQGILMERERITADQAFDLLRLSSQHLNLRLRDVAQDLVDTGLYSRPC